MYPDFFLKKPQKRWKVIINYEGRKEARCVYVGGGALNFN